VKRNRPIASGALPEPHAVVLAAELTSLGEDAVRHRPVMRWYRPGMLRVGQLIVGLGMLATYLMWAVNETTAARPWHLLSALPLAAGPGSRC
jgi:hypothetical protein